MVRFFLSFFLILAAGQSHSDEIAPIEKILTVNAINGTKQAGVLSSLSNVQAPSILVVIIPGHPTMLRASANSLTGKIELQHPGSFVVRERLRLLDADIATLVVDCRSDFYAVCSDDYQMSEQRYKDVLPLMEAAKNTFPSIKQVWLLSTSRGFLSSAGFTKYAGDYFTGIIHTAGTTDLLERYPGAIAKSATPQYFYHHLDDPCFITKHATAKATAQKLDAALITVTGGSGFYGGACQANTQHGFKGVEDKVMAHIARLMKTGRVDTLQTQ